MWSSAVKHMSKQQMMSTSRATLFSSSTIQNPISAWMKEESHVFSTRHGMLESFRAFHYAATTWSLQGGGATKVLLNNSGKKGDQESKQDKNSTNGDNNEKDHFKIFNFNTWLNMFGICSLPYFAWMAYYYFKRLSLSNNEDLKLLLNETFIKPNEQDRVLDLLKEILSLVKAHQYIEDFFNVVSFLR